MGVQGVSGLPSWKSAEIGLFRPFSAFLALFRRARRAPGKSRKRRKKAFFLRYPRICLNPHLLNPHLRHSNLFSLPGSIGQLSPNFGVIPLLNYTANLEKRRKIHWRIFKKIQRRNFPEITNFLSLVVVSAVNQRGRERPPEIIQKFRLSRVADFECRFPYDSYGKNRAPFWPFWGEGFWGNIRRPILLPAPLSCC